MDVAEANSLPQQLQTRGEAAAAGGRPGRRAWHRQTRGRVTHTLPDHKPQGTGRNCSLVGPGPGAEPSERLRRGGIWATLLLPVLPY